MAYVGGHEFLDGTRGKRCIRCQPDGTLCDAAWQHVRTAQSTDVGKPGFAHQGNLTLTEYTEIAAAVEKENQVLWQAIVDAASAGSR